MLLPESMTSIIFQAAFSPFPMDEFMHIDTTYPYPWMGVSVFESSDLDIADFGELTPKWFGK